MALNGLAPAVTPFANYAPRYFTNKLSGPPTTAFWSLDLSA